MFDLNLNKTPKIAYKELRSDSFTPKVIFNNFHVEASLESAYINALKGRYSIMILKSAFKIYKLSDIYLFSSLSTKINLNEINKNKKYLDWKLDNNFLPSIREQMRIWKQIHFKR